MTWKNSIIQPCLLQYEPNPKSASSQIAASQFHIVITSLHLQPPILRRLLRRWCAKKTCSDFAMETILYRDAGVRSDIPNYRRSQSKNLKRGIMMMQRQRHLCNFFNFTNYIFLPPFSMNDCLCYVNNFWSEGWIVQEQFVFQTSVLLFENRFMVHQTIKSVQFNSGEIVNGSVQFYQTVLTAWVG